MNAADLLGLLRRRSRPTETHADDHVPVAVRAAPPNECDRVALPPPTSREASPCSEAEPLAVPKPPRPVPRPALSPAREGGARPGKLAALTPVLGRQKAGQALWAPHLLTEAEQQRAEQILKRFR